MKVMKKRIGLIMVVAVILSFATGVIAKTVYETVKVQIRQDFVVEIDGEVKEFKNIDGKRVYPILYDGTTYLPIRAIGNIMGKKVYWYENEKKIELKDEEKNSKTTVTDADVIVQNDNKEDKGEKQKETVDKVGYISEEKAKIIALDKAELSEEEVNFIKIKFEKDDGIYIYDIEFQKGYTEYNADIRADDGKILEWDVDIDD